MKKVIKTDHLLIHNLTQYLKKLDFTMELFFQFWSEQLEKAYP